MDTQTPQSQEKITYINQKQAADADVYLMSPEIGYPLEVLMELAGQSITHVTQDIFDKYLPKSESPQKILLFCGPGNNGGDGLVVARHLLQYPQFLPEVFIVRPYEQGPNKLLTDLLTNLGVTIHYYPKLIEQNPQFSIQSFLQDGNYCLLIDALFGFSFKPPIRSPYDLIISAFKEWENRILSVDIPSGWNVEKGNVDGLFVPKYNVSLMLVKLGMKDFKGIHYLGGRFMPKQLEEKLGIKKPNFDGNQQFKPLL